MSKLTVLLLCSLLFAGRAVAQDSFEREFSKFDKDFERLNTWKADTPASKKLKRAPAAPDSPAANQPTTTELPAGGTVTPLTDSASPPASPSVPTPMQAPLQPTEGQPAAEEAAPKPAKSSALPKGAKVERLARNDRLGNEISDPVMRKKVQDLYRRKDVVVHQYVFPTN